MVLCSLVADIFLFYFFTVVLLFSLAVCGLWLSFVVYHFFYFPVCDLSQREKLVLCGLAANVFGLFLFFIVVLLFSLAVCVLWLSFLVYHFSIFLCVICR